MKFNPGIQFKILMNIIIVSLIALVLLIFFMKNSNEEKAVNNANETAKMLALEQSLTIEKYLDAKMKYISAFTSYLNGMDNLSPSQLVEKSNGVIQNMLKDDPDFKAIVVSWDKTFTNETWNKPYGREIHSFFRMNNKIEYNKLSYDSLNENQDTYFYSVKASGKGQFFDPSGENGFTTIYNSHEPLTGFIMPVILNGNFAGTIRADIPVSAFNEMVNAREIHENYQSFLVSENGKIINYSDESFIGGSIAEMIDLTREESLNVRSKIEAGELFQLSSQRTKENLNFYFYPIYLPRFDSNLSIGIRNNLSPVYAQVSKAIGNAFLIGLLGVLILSLIIAYFLRFSFIRPIKQSTRVIRAISQGDIKKEYEISSSGKDEIAQINQSINELIEGLSAKIEFARSIGDGEFNTDFKKSGENDMLGEALINMRDNLEKARKDEAQRKIEDAKQSWVTQGLAKFGDILRQNTDNMEEFSYSIISNLVKYLDANQGGIFMIDREEENQFVELKAAFAYERRKYMEKRMDVGEGMIGRCILEKETIYMTEIPNDYIHITSGLGKDNPRSLLIVPLILNDEVYGVIEIASFREIEEHQIKFVEKIGESIASTISTVLTNLRTAELLEQSKKQAEELASQEEEMRQNLEELQATQEESARKEAEMAGIFRAMNNTLFVAQYDIDGKILDMNDQFAGIFHSSKDTMLGQNIKNVFIANGMNGSEFDDIINQVKNQKIINRVDYFKVNGIERWINQTFAPILNNEGHVTKILNFASDVTEAKLKEKQVEENQQMLTNLVNEIPAKVFLKDSQGKMVMVNKKVADAHQCEPEELIGMSDFDFFKDDPALAKQLFEEEQEIIKEGGRTWEQKETVGDQDIFLRTTKMPIYLPHLGETGVFGFQVDITELKQMEYEIKNNHENLQKVHDEMMQEKALMDALMANIPDNIYFKDLESKFLRVSENMAKAFKVESSDDLKGKSDFDFFTDDHARPAYEGEMDIIKTGEPIVDLVEKETFDDGTVSWVSTTKMPLRDQQGNIIGTFGISKDVTNFKKMEENLRKKNADIMKEKTLMDALMKNLPDYIYFKDKECKFIRISESMVKLFPGAEKAGDLIGKSDFDFHTKENAQKFYQDEQKIMKTEKPLIDDIVKEELHDGSVQWVSTTKMPLKDYDGNVIGLFGISKNITELKEMEQDTKQKNEELETQEEELRQNLEEMQAVQESLSKKNEEIMKEKTLMDALMKNLPDYIYFKDKECKFIRISESMVKLFPGAEKAGDLIGKSDFDFHTKENAQKFYQDEQKIMKTEKPLIDDIVKEELHDGSVQWVSTTKMPLKDYDGNVIGLFGISKNITELKEMEQDTKQKNEELETQEEELRQNLEEMQAVQEDLVKKQKDLMWESTMFNTLLDYLDDRVTFKDNESNYVRVNKAKAKKLGYNDPSEITGKSDFDFFGKEHGEKAKKEDSIILKSKEPVLNKEEKITTNDGSAIWGMTSRIPLINKEGEAIGTFAITKDITDLKQKEMTLEKFKKDIQNDTIIINGLTDNLPVLVYEITPNREILKIQGAGLKFMNETEEKVLGRKLDELIPESGELDGKKPGNKTMISFNHKCKKGRTQIELKHYVFSKNGEDDTIVGYAYQVGLI